MNKNETLRLLLKYHGKGARYAYYPPLSLWSQNQPFSWEQTLEENYCPRQGLDLYIHIPYCRKLCTFCGCNIKITSFQEEEVPYIEQLIQEWDLKKKILQPIKLSSLTIGGGSPNFLSPLIFKKLLASLFTEVQLSPKFRFSLELDPRYLKKNWLEPLKEHPFPASSLFFSLGVQDFNERVLTNVNRYQTEKEIILACDLIRENFPDSEIGIDLIYGLPHQKINQIDQWSKPLKKILPDQIAFYPLAQVPWQESAQKAFGDFTLHSQEDKYQLLLAGHEIFTALNFLHLGFGHYAKPQSTLGHTYTQGTLYRQVMGFSPLKGSIQLALGVSGLSVAGRTRWQNQRILDKYLHTKDLTQAERFHHQTEKEQNKEQGLHQIACRRMLPSNYSPHLKKQYQQEGIIGSDGMSLTETGKLLLKSLCQNYLC